MAKGRAAMPGLTGSFEYFTPLNPPARVADWYLRTDVGSLQSGGQSQTPGELPISDDEALADIVSGGFWRQPALATTPLTKIHLSPESVDRLEQCGVWDAYTLFSTPWGQLTASGASRADLAGIMAAACVPPENVSLNWPSLGECLFRLLRFDVTQHASTSTESLPLQRGVIRGLLRNGMTTLGRLLLTDPNVLLSMRQFGPIRLTAICLSLTGGPLSASKPLIKAGSGRRRPLHDWLQVVIRPPTFTQLAQATKLVTMTTAEAAERTTDANEREVLAETEESLDLRGFDGQTYMRLLTLLAGHPAPTKK